MYLYSHTGTGFVAEVLKSFMYSVVAAQLWVFNQVCDLLEEVYMIKSSSHFVQYTSTAHRSRPGSQNGTPRSSPALKSIKDFQLQNR